MKMNMMKAALTAKQKIYRERQSDDRYVSNDITHWLYGYGEEMSVSADEVDADDIYTKRA
jgi:hypothetical protein